MGVKKNLWLFVFNVVCLVIAIVLCSGFMYYFCVANPSNIVYAKEDSSAEKVELNKQEISKLQKDDLSNQDSKQSAVVEEKTDKTTVSLVLNKENEAIIKNMERRNSFLEFYIGQIISFYQQVITYLLGVIGVLLVISFMYIRFTSKQQTEEMANEALNSKSFQIILQNLVKKEYAEALKSGDFVEMSSKIPDLADRVTELEKIMNAKDDDEIQE